MKPKDGLHSEELVVSPMSPKLSEGKKRKRKDYSEERSGDAVVIRSKVKTQSGKVENLKKMRVYYKKVVYDEGEFEVGDDVYVKRREDACSDEEDPEVKECRICFRAGRNVMLECDDYLGGFHLKCLKPPLKEVPEGEWVCEFCEARKLGKKIELLKPPEGKKRVSTMREKLLSSDLWAANIQSMWNEVDGNYWCRVCSYMIPEEIVAERQPHNFRLRFGEAKKKKKNKQTNKTILFCLYSGFAPGFDPGQTSFSMPFTWPQAKEDLLELQIWHGVQEKEFRVEYSHSSFSQACLDVEQLATKDAIFSVEDNFLWVENKTIKIRNSNIVAILEPKISGVKADNFIKRSGFELSHRVEAEVSFNFPIANAFPRIDEYSLVDLSRTILNEEIKATIFRMNPLKAPGIDGLHGLFYQSQWDVVGSSICELVSNIFKGNPLPPELNKTLIVLIPKTNNPTNLRMFCPISLCLVMYKTVTKILANRLKGILPELIRPTQTSFVPGRQIIENIVMAQEIIHTMRNKKGKIGQMAIKVDLEKAYDRLSWDFIHDTLKDVGLPKEFIRITMECITTARMQIL
ncbi:hypothetical protein KPL70_016905 [Citrus sinensis]|nr:hypothetical protein KPL70_016905 [Citrus sinensis]